LVAERAAAGTFEILACRVIDAQVHRIAHQQAEHHTAVEQPDAAEHAARHGIERAEQVQDEILEAAAHRHGSERQ
jgi:hypothetical protein